MTDRPSGSTVWPRREAGLHALDAGAGLLLYVGCAFVAVELFRHLPAGWTTGTRTLLLQVLTFGPAIAWLLMRLLGEAGGFAAAGFRTPRGSDLALGLGVGLLGCVLSPILLFVMVNFGQALGDPPASETAHQMFQVILAAEGLELVAVLMSTLVMAPVLEELLFRVLGQTGLLGSLGWDRRLRLVVTAGIAGLFAVIHLGAVTWHALPSLMLLGLLFGLIYESTGRILPGIIAHAVFNAVNVAYYLVALSMGWIGA